MCVFIHIGPKVSTPLARCDAPNNAIHSFSSSLSTQDHLTKSFHAFCDSLAFPAFLKFQSNHSAVVVCMHVFVYVCMYAEHNCVCICVCTGIEIMR